MKTKTIHGVPTGNHCNPNVLAAARRAGGDGGWKKGDATEKPDGKKFASGGSVGKQSDDDGKGGWVPKDGSSRPSGKAFSKGGRAKGKC